MRPLEDSLHLSLCHHHGHLGMALGPDRRNLSLNRLVQDIPVQKDDRVQRLTLCGGRNFPIACKVAEKPLHLLFPNVLGVSLAPMESDETDNPVAIGLLCTVGIMVVSQDLSDLVHELEPAVRLELRLAFHFCRSYNIKNGRSALAFSAFISLVSQ
jgi:hypothetical protein